MKRKKVNQEGLESKRTRCEVFSRIVGYLRPVSQWNPGKEAEFYKRREYIVSQ